MTLERLQKVLARAGVASRRKAEELIREGRVTVNGRPAELGSKADPESDAIKVDGRRILPQQERHYLVLNKPRGYITTRSDPEGRPTVFDLVPARLRKALVAVGRLDYHTEGLLLLTDDGELAQRVAHPRYGCTKTYAVKVKGVPEKTKLAKLRTGIVVEGRRTSTARITPRRPSGKASAENSWWTVEIGEGRTRQVREMFFRIGHPVQKLRRVAIGPVSDPRLPLGAYRELTRAELDALRRQTVRGRTPQTRRRGPGKPRDKRRSRVGEP